MKSISQAFIAILCFFIISSYSLLAQNNIAKNGVVDLSELNWDVSPNITLEGDWDFYWQQFVEPGGVKESTISHDKLKATLPAPWTKVELSEGIKCPAQGYATYRLRIKLPNKDQIYALKMFSVFSAYKMFINGELATKVGKIGKTKAESKPEFSTKVVPLVIKRKGGDESQTAEILVQVSNFYHRRAGLQKAIQIGTIDEIISKTQKDIVINILLIGIILIIGLNHVLMYLLRRLDISNLIFGLLATVMILRNLTTGERLLADWLPNLSWEMLVRLDNFSGFATISLFAFYFFFSYRKDFPKIMFYIIMSIGTIITLLVFTSSAWFYGQFRLIFEAYIGLGGLYLVFGVLLASALRKRQGAFITFIGMFLLYSTAVIDVLSSMGVLKTAFIAPYGIAAFMILQSFLLTKKSALALKENQTLSKELKLEKQNLEDRIEERTQELTRQTAELEQHREKQERQNWINESLNQLNEIMRQNKDNMLILADSLLSNMIKNLKATLGALYFLTKHDDTEVLKLIAHYGLSKDHLNNELDLREGLVGKCFSTGKTNKFNELPNGYFEINSGLGSATPSNLILVPMIVDEMVIGVLEIASFKDFVDFQVDYIEKAIANIAAQLNIVKMNDETKKMLNNYKHYEKELHKKEEEFRIMHEELEMLREKQIASR